MSSNLFELLTKRKNNASIAKFPFRECEIIDYQSHCLLACIFMGALYYRSHSKCKFEATREFLQEQLTGLNKSFKKGLTITWILRRLDDLLTEKIDTKSDIEKAIFTLDNEDIENSDGGKLFSIEEIAVARFTDLLINLLVEPKSILILSFDYLKAEGRASSGEHAVILESVNLKDKKITIIDPIRFDISAKPPQLESYRYDALQFDKGWKIYGRKVIRMLVRSEKDRIIKKLENFKDGPSVKSLEDYFKK